jgi:glycosyltransferase involved in cell wall biosynthesis
MMVLNEAGNIRKVLESVRHHIDRWTIIDTGSQDGTQDIIREVLAGIPGKLYEESFKGYAATRNRVLFLDSLPVDEGGHSEIARFQLMLSGDEYLRNGDKLREYLIEYGDKADCHLLKLFIDDTMTPVRRITRTGSEWRYQDFDCGIHEVPVHPNENAPLGFCAGATIDHVVSDPLRRLDTIWEKHIPLLKEALDRNPENARALEYLTKSYEYLMPFVEDDERKALATECLDLYQRRFELPFVCDEEKHLFKMRYLDDARFSGVFKPQELLIQAVELAQESDRSEPAMLVAQIASSIDGFKVGDIYRLARRAADKAHSELRTFDELKYGTSPRTTSIEWKAHRLAAIAACQLASSSPEMMNVAKDHVQAGMAAGGPPEWFSDVPISQATP